MIINERTIWEGHPDFTSWTLMHLSVILLMGFFFVLMPLVVMASQVTFVNNLFIRLGVDIAAYFSSTTPHSTTLTLDLIPLIIFFLLPGLAFVLSSLTQLLFGWFTTYYTFTNKGIRLEYGILHKEDVVIPIETIENAGAIKVVGDRIYGMFGGNTATITMRLKTKYIPSAISWIKNFGIDINFPMSIYCVPNAENILKDMGITIDENAGFYPEPGTLDKSEDDTNLDIDNTLITR